jgi:hypothetical protein
MTIEPDATGARIPLQRDAADEAHLKKSVERDLCVEFPSVPVDQVTILVECLWSHFEGALIRDFVPLLVRKQAKEELLDHLGTRAEATVPLPRPLPTARP